MSNDLIIREKSLYPLVLFPDKESLIKIGRFRIIDYQIKLSQVQGISSFYFITVSKQAARYIQKKYNKLNIKILFFSQNTNKNNFNSCLYDNLEDLPETFFCISNNSIINIDYSKMQTIFNISNRYILLPIYESNRGPILLFRENKILFKNEELHYGKTYKNYDFYLINKSLFPKFSNKFSNRNTFNKILEVLSFENQIIPYLLDLKTNRIPSESYEPFNPSKFFIFSPITNNCPDLYDPDYEKVKFLEYAVVDFIKKL